MKGMFFAVMLAVSGLATANVVVNEIMFNPSAALGDDNLYEWVEIFNNGSTPVDISGWIMTDLDTGSGCIVPAGTTIAANGYLVFARNGADFVAHYGSGVPLVAWTGSWGSGLSNDADDVVLMSSDSTVIDQVPYDDTIEWGSDYGDDNTYSDADGDGASLERINPDGIPAEPATWDSSTDEDSGIPDSDWAGHNESHGTPGAVNSVSTISLGPQTWARIKLEF